MPIWDPTWFRGHFRSLMVPIAFAHTAPFIRLLPNASMLEQKLSSKCLLHIKGYIHKGKMDPGIECGINENQTSVTKYEPNFNFQFSTNLQLLNIDETSALRTRPNFNINNCQHRHLKWHLQLPGSHQSSLKNIPEWQNDRQGKTTKGPGSDINSLHIFFCWHYLIQQVKTYFKICASWLEGNKIFWRSFYRKSKVLQ